MQASTSLMTTPMARRAVFALAVCGICFLAGCLGCAIWQRSMIYYPPKFAPAKTDSMAKEVKLERWRNGAGEAIGMKRMSPKQPAEGQVLITYGNGSCAAWCARYADVIQQAAALDVFIVEYPGYADRPGKPSEEGLFAAAEEGLGLLATNRAIYLVGESLGTGVATYLAGKHPDQVAGVVLLAPYNRLVDVAQYHVKVLPANLLLVDRFESQEHLSHYRGPIAVLVGGRDGVVPKKFGKRLYDGYAGPKRLWEYPEADHGTVTERSAKEWGEILGFLREKGK